MEYSSIKDDSEAFIIEKKSKFIANIVHVNSIKEAEEALNEIKKKHYDAKHHCFAYRVIDEDKVSERFSDDGEPSGTAGAPMLEILRGNNLVNTIAIVTRYFGGILLGTGGLVKAYSEATSKAIEQTEVVHIYKICVLKLTVDYSEFEKLKYYINKIGGLICKSDYKNDIEVIIEIPINQKEEFVKQYTNVPFKINSCNIIEEKFGYISSKTD